MDEKQVLVPRLRFPEFQEAGEVVGDIKVFKETTQVIKVIRATKDRRVAQLAKINLT